MVMATVEGSRVEDVTLDRVMRVRGGWEQFEALQLGFVQNPGVRLCFFAGRIEIFMPGRAHEVFKTIIGMLIEVFLLDRGVEFEATGSMTQKVEGVAAVEPDESYEIDGMRLAIEVNFSSGGVDKLEVYRVLGVDEVWFWEDGVLDVYCLGDGGYEKGLRSGIPVLSGVDLEVLASCILVGETSKVGAVKRLRDGGAD